MKIFIIPIAIAFNIAIGLAAALLGDGLLDVAAWVGLLLPIVCVIVAMRGTPIT